MTQISWKRVSKRAKERPRLASGASRWTIESKASLPALAATPTPEGDDGGAEEPADGGGHEPGDRGAEQGALEDALLARHGPQAGARARRR